MGFITKYSLGNMGGSESICKFAPMDSDFLTLQCQSGTMHFDKYDFGIIPGNSKEKNYCLNNDITDGCN